MRESGNWNLFRDRKSSGKLELASFHLENFDHSAQVNNFHNEKIIAMIALHCEGIVKRFGANTALAAADLNVPASTIHALVGENGAGKSTLINIISGLLKFDQGQLSVFDQQVQFQSPLDAAACGIGMVHQHFLLAEALSV